MAWGYWSATSVSDRGRSPRREKEKQPQYQQAPQAPQPVQVTSSQQVAEPQQPCSSLQQIQPDLEDTPCGRMIQTAGPFYSTYSSTITTTAPGGWRTSAEVPVSGIQVLPTRFPSSPGGSDSAEYEQPSCAHLGAYLPQDDPVPSSSSRLKLFRDEDEEEDPDFDDIPPAEMIYRSGVQPGPSGCLIHGPCATVEPAPSVASSTNEDQSVGPSQYWFNDITWGRSAETWDQVPRDDSH